MVASGGKSPDLFVKLLRTQGTGRKLAAPDDVRYQLTVWGSRSSDLITSSGATVFSALSRGNSRRTSWSIRIDDGSCLGGRTKKAPSTLVSLGRDSGAPGAVKMTRIVPTGNHHSLLVKAEIDMSRCPVVNRVSHGLLASCDQSEGHRT